MRYDLWAGEREKAEVLENGLKVLKTEVEGNGFYLKLWNPKATKPFANYRFKTAEQREEYIAKQVAALNDWQARKMLQKLARQGVGVEGSENAVKVGDIFHASWGYDQTNNDFYQVVAKNGRHVTLREIGQKSVPGTQGFMSENVVAVKDAFTNKAPFKKLVQFSGSSPYIRIESYCSARLWDGKQCYNSWYA